MALDLTTPRDRIRHAVGDVGASALHPDGLSFYSAALTAADGDEVAAWRLAARGLAMYLQHKPVSLGASGKSLTFDARRIGRLLAIAEGAVCYPFDPATGDPVVAQAGGDAALEVVW